MLRLRSSRYCNQNVVEITFNLALIQSVITKRICITLQFMSNMKPVAPCDHVRKAETYAICSHGDHHNGHVRANKGAEFLSVLIFSTEEASKQVMLDMGYTKYQLILVPLLELLEL